MYKFLIFSGGMVFHHFKADKIKTSYACEGSPTAQSSPPLLLAKPNPVVILRSEHPASAVRLSPKNLLAARASETLIKLIKLEFAYSKPAQNAEIFHAVEKSQPFNSSKTLAKAMLRCEREGFLFASF